MATKGFVPRANNQGTLGTALKRWATAYVKKLFFAIAPDADDYEGEAIIATAHESVALGDLCFVNSDGEMAKADMNASATMPVRYMAVATIGANTQGAFLRSGIIHLHTLAPAWTKGALIFAGAAGAMGAAPTGTGDQAQIVGVALAADILDFNPSLVVGGVA